jgi:hypothetical protein
MGAATVTHNHAGRAVLFEYGRAAASFLLLCIHRSRVGFVSLHTRLNNSCHTASSLAEVYYQL